MSAELVLDVLDFAELPGGGLDWRWELRGPDGGVLAEHAVRLEVGDELLTALTDLPRYLRLNTVPDTRAVEEPKLLARIGQEISERVFGPVAGVLDDYGPCAVRVRVAPQARAVAHLPLESTVLGDRTLPERGCSLVWDLLASPTDPPPEHKQPIGNKLRVLALFSLPDGTSALNLRKERRELLERLDELTRGGRAIELRVLQYGTTRAWLESVIKEEAPWHVVHISGHGWTADRPRDRDSGILLEEPDGSQDWIPTEKLVELLAPLRGHVRLVTASSCSSAGVTAAEYRRLLGLEEADGADDEAGADDAPPSDAAPILAVRLAETLNCAVLGMRHNVTDDFAAALAAEVYPRLLAGGGAPAAILGGSVQAALGSGPHPPLSASTPALFGAAAAGETIAAPVTDSPVSVKPEPIPGVAEPERFIGRTKVMARAGAALAPESGSSGVLLHGMAGAGKTTAAEELVALHRDRFDSIVWYRAPDEGHDAALALSDLAGTLGQHLEDLDLVALTDDPEKLRAVAPQLTERFERDRILLVIDNAESLLTEDWAWRDEHWGMLVDALTGHDGPSRVVLTSRHCPAALDARVLEAPLHALSGDEAVLLARELPHLRALFDDEAGKELLGRVLTLTQGHPVLLEIADGHAAAPDTLRALLDQAEDTWQERGAVPDGFFTRTGSTGTGEDYLAVLGSWTNTAIRDLGEPVQVLLQMLACMEPGDRFGFFIDANWADLWYAFERSAPVPQWHALLTTLTAHGLAETRHHPADPRLTAVLLQPPISTVARHRAGLRFQELIDLQLADFWTGNTSYYWEHELTQTGSRALIHAARAALPYLLRLGHTGAATALLEQVLHRDDSPTAAAALLPLARATADTSQDAAHQTDAEFVLSRALLPTHPDEGELRLRALMDTARDTEDYHRAAIIATSLFNHYYATGRLPEALTLNEQHISDSRRAGHDRWTQALVLAQRLQILNHMGEYTVVLEQVQDLLIGLDQSTAPASEAVHVWDVREALLDTARVAAQGLGRWQEALQFSDRIAESENRRGAPDLESARTRLYAHRSLIELGRLEDAEVLLQEFREVFEVHKDWAELGRTLGALAHVQSVRGEAGRVVATESDALRYQYLAGDTRSAAVSHNNLGTHLAARGQRSGALRHHLTAALLHDLTRDGTRSQSVLNTARDLTHLPPDHPAPATLEALCAEVDQLPGVQLAGLLARLATPETAQAALDRVLTEARQLARVFHDETAE